MGDERVHVIRARPLRNATYHHAEFRVARADHAILEVRYFKRAAEQPYRIVHAPRDAMVQGGGHVLPSRLLVENKVRNTTTEVLFHKLEIEPEIDDRIFSVGTLDQERELPLPGAP